MAGLNLLVGVGGTGQHVAIAYLHLARLAGFKPEPIVIIDNDGGAATMLTLNRLKADFWPGSAVSAGGRLSPYPDDLRGDTPREVFHGEEPNGLLNVFLERYPTNPERGSEQDAFIKKGYYGFPQLGSIFARALFAPMTDNNPVNRMILGPIHAAGSPRRLAISGSIVGGCGSGVIPELVAAIDGFQMAQGYSGPKRIRVQTAVNLLTFVLEGEPPAPKAGDTSAYADRRKINEQIMRENATSGLVYFRDNLAAKSDRFVLIGNPQGHDRRPNDGHKDAKETPDYYHVLQAVLQHMFFNADPTFIEVPLSERIRVFSSGDGPISPRVLPVIPESVLGIARHRLPLDNFEMPLSSLKIKLNGQPLNQLLPRTSLFKWMWVARTEIECADICLDLLADGRWDIYTDFRDQMRNLNLLSEARIVVEDERSKTIASLNWIRAAFWDLSVDPPVVRPAVEQHSSCWEMLLDYPRVSWDSEVGKRIRTQIENADFAPKGFFRAWKPERVEWNAQVAGKELYRRCRLLAEHLVDGEIQ